MPETRTPPATTRFAERIDESVVDRQRPYFLCELGRHFRPVPGRSADIVLEKPDSGAARDANEHDEQLQVLGDNRADVFCKEAAEDALCGFSEKL